MSINEKQNLVYFRGQGLVEVTAEFKKEHERECARIRMQKQYHGECFCRKSQINLCDGFCDDCPFRAPGKFVSMDDPVSDTDGLARGDLIPASDDYSVEYLVTKHFLQGRATAIFNGCTPDEKQMPQGITSNSGRLQKARNTRPLCDVAKLLETFLSLIKIIFYFTTETRDINTINVILLMTILFILSVFTIYLVIKHYQLFKRTKNNTYRKYEWPHRQHRIRNVTLKLALALLDGK